MHQIRIPCACTVLRPGCTLPATSACLQGRGWTLLHTYGDLLWQMGDKTPPNEGFTAARIFPTEAPAEAAAPAPAGDDGSTADAAGEAAQQLEGLSVGEAGGAAGGGAAACGAAEDGGAGGAGGSGADMDALLEAAVLVGLQSLKTAEMPIQARAPRRRE